jgi:hypothetical protein
MGVGENPIAAAMGQRGDELAREERQRRQNDLDDARQVKLQGLSADLQNATSPEQAQELLSGMLNTIQGPHESHHVFNALRGLVGRLTGHRQRQPWDEQPPVPLTPSQGGQAAGPQQPQAAPSGTLLGPGSYAPPPQVTGPAPGGPARPVPPSMQGKARPDGKQLKTDPAVDLFAKYWRSPAQISAQETQLETQKENEKDDAKIARFHRRLDQLRITDPKQRQDMETEFIRAEFSMKAPPGKPSFKNFRLRDGSIVPLDVNAEGFQPPEGSHIETSTRVVTTPGASIGVTDAQTLVGQGAVFKDRDGKEIDVSQLKPWEKLVPSFSGSESFYTIADQRQRPVAAGNQITAQPELGQLQPVGQAPNLGARYPATSSTHTETAPDGTQVLVTTTTTTRGAGGAPAGPGATTAPGAAAPKGPAPGGPARAMPPGTAAAPGAGPAAPGAKGDMEQRVKTQGVMPDISHMTQKNATATRKLLPAVTALLGMYGDPQSPQVPSMADYADLANDEHAKKTLGPAFVLLNRVVGNVTDPGKIDTLANAAGWANYQAEVEAQIQRLQGEKMTPREKEYFNAAIAGMADIIGSRAATGASAAKFSVEAIQNELPLIGLSSTTNKQEYLTKMLTISRQLDVGLGAMPDKDRAVWWLNKRRGDLEAELQKGPAPGGPPRPGAPGSKAAIKVSAEDMK